MEGNGLKIRKRKTRGGPAKQAARDRKKEGGEKEGKIEDIKQRGLQGQNRGSTGGTKHNLLIQGAGEENSRNSGRGGKTVKRKKGERVRINQIRQPGIKRYAKSEKNGRSWEKKLVDRPWGNKGELMGKERKRGDWGGPSNRGGERSGSTSSLEKGCTSSPGQVRNC